MFLQKALLTPLPTPAPLSNRALKWRCCSNSLYSLDLNCRCPGGGMADAEDLKSSGDFSSCGFDSHPGHHHFKTLIELLEALRRAPLSPLLHFLYTSRSNCRACQAPRRDDPVRDARSAASRRASCGASVPSQRGCPRPPSRGATRMCAGGRASEKPASLPETFRPVSPVHGRDPSPLGD